MEARIATRPIGAFSFRTVLQIVPVYPTYTSIVSLANASKTIVDPILPSTSATPPAPSTFSRRTSARINCSVIPFAPIRTRCPARIFCGKSFLCDSAGLLPTFTMFENPAERPANIPDEIPVTTIPSMTHVAITSGIRRRD